LRGAKTYVYESVTYKGLGDGAVEASVDGGFLTSHGDGDLVGVDSGGGEGGEEGSEGVHNEDLRVRLSKWERRRRRGREDEERRER
jgi:hypothetical protein